LFKLRNRLSLADDHAVSELARFASQVLIGRQGFPA
jgi:hypothetical protein